MNKAIFAAGCFWCIEEIYDAMDGVNKTTVGYIGGNTQSPTYEDVCTGDTNHAEAIEIEYDETIIKFETLLNTFWEIHDPTTLNRQGPDVGTQYRSAIFYTNEEQRIKSEESGAAKSRFGAKRLWNDRACCRAETRSPNNSRWR